MSLNYDKDAFLRAIDLDGSCFVEGLLDGDFVDRLRSDLELAIEQEARYHGGTDYKDYGMVQCCPMYSRSFVEVFDCQEIVEPIEAVLGEGCIAYSYSSSSQPPGAVNFSGRIHVDSPRLIPGYLTNFGLILLLDDFTEENGATWYLPGSHRDPEPPSEQDFYATAQRLVGPAGSAWFFDPRLWHAGERNRTDRWRHSLTFNMSRPYVKQRFDIPRMLRGQDLTGVSARALQKLGFDAQPPTCLEEYYAPPEERTFRQEYE